MRIISGTYKGKKIFLPKDKSTRPLKDLTKESIFNIIQHSPFFKKKIENTNILDLFAGVGSFGLECLSRGSDMVTFVENYTAVLPILKKNIKNIDLQNKCKIIEKNIFLENTISEINDRFDIIFIDPPYKENRLIDLLKLLIHSKILKKGGFFIIHRHKKEKDEYPPKFKLFKVKKYGISKIIFGV